MPGRPFNVFSEDMMADVATLIDHAESQLNGLVLTSSKSAFAAGADLTMIKDFADMRFHATAGEMKQRFSTLGRLFRRLEGLDIPVVAAVNGLALGGGLEVALACHRRLCADVNAPILGLPEIQLGLLPGAGGTQRLPRLIGAEPAIGMLLKGNPVTPAEALALGLVDRVTSPESLVDEAVDLARSMVSASDSGARWDAPDWQPLVADQQLVHSDEWREQAHQLGGWSEKNPALYPAVEAIVQCVAQGLALDIDTGSEREWDIFVELMSDPIVANMVVTCFLNKTAAPKIAAQFCTNIESPKAFHWQSALPAPRSLGKKLVADSESADLVINDLAADISGDDNRQLYIRSIDIATAHKASGGTVSFIGDLTKAAACEVMKGDAECTAKGVALVSAMRKIPVVVNTAGGVLAPVLSALELSLAKLGERCNADVLHSVELQDAAVLLGRDCDLQAGQRAPATRDALGMTVLVEMALAAWQCLKAGAIDNAEMLDVLVVYGLGYPKWTGGPLSLLAMYQREELDTVQLPEELKQQIAAIDTPLKNRAGYAL